MESTAIAGYTGQATIDQAVTIWLESKRERSGSERTARAYGDGMASYRAALSRVALDLDGPPAALALILQKWAGQDKEGREAAPASFNQRIAIVSSFYTFARRRGLLSLENPASLVERRKVQTYASARPLSASAIESKMKQIDRRTLAGKRDYALLSIALATGRRLAELAALTYGDIHIDGQAVTLTWPHCKGGQIMRDTLPRSIGRALLEYLSAFYGAGLGTLAHNAPVWVALDKGHYGAALSERSISDVCLKRLGVSKVHTTRHTFAHQMEEAGAKISEIQARLGHSNIAITSRYLASLRSASNPHAETLAAMFGLE